MTDDLISRQAAIDIERNATVDTNPSHFEAHQKFTQFMDDAEISSFGRWQWSNGFNTALTAVGIDLKKLPSAQRWIPCSIKLPKKTDLYYVTIRAEDGTEYTSCMCYYINLARWEVDVNVIAWMPNPEPYRG